MSGAKSFPLHIPSGITAPLPVEFSCGPQSDEVSSGRAEDVQEQYGAASQCCKRSVFLAGGIDRNVTGLIDSLSSFEFRFCSPS